MIYHLQPASKSSALNKAAAYTNKYQPTRAEIVKLSDDSELEDMSFDEDIMQSLQPAKVSVKAPVKAPAKTPAKAPAKAPAPKDLKAKSPKAKTQQPTTKSPDLSNDSDLGMANASKFMKKKPMQPVFTNAVDSEEDSMSIGKGGNRFMKKKAKKAKPGIEEKIETMEDDDLTPGR